MFNKKARIKALEEEVAAVKEVHTSTFSKELLELHDEIMREVQRRMAPVMDTVDRLQKESVTTLLKSPKDRKCS